MTLKSLVFLVCSVIARGARIERRTHTQTHRPSTVTLAAHARRGVTSLLQLIKCETGSVSGASALDQLPESVSKTQDVVVQTEGLCTVDVGTETDISSQSLEIECHALRKEKCELYKSFQMSIKIFESDRSFTQS